MEVARADDRANDVRAGERTVDQRTVGRAGRQRASARADGRARGHANAHTHARRRTRASVRAGGQTFAGGRERAGELNFELNVFLKTQSFFGSVTGFLPKLLPRGRDSLGEL